jgi:hypothetical protein
MLHDPSKSNGHRKQSRRQALYCGASGLALFAADLVAWGVWHGSKRELCRLLKVAPSYFWAASALAPEQRDAIEHGLITLSQIHNANRKVPSDRALEGIVRRNANRVWDMLEKFTAPAE